MLLNLYAGWLGILIGCIAGAIPGMFFYANDWVGGYTSWPRRLIRLAHISFFGLGFLNLLFALTARALAIEPAVRPAGILLIVGAAAMPTVCYLSAWKPAFRHLFFIPVASVTLGVALFGWRVIGS